MSIKENIAEVRKNIPESVQLVCVSKFHPVEAIKEAYQAGERFFGENRPQEFASKAIELKNFATDIKWQFIGNLQTNKVKMVVPYADMIHSLSSDRLADEIEKQAAKIGKIQKVLIELHVADEETKQGFTPDEAFSLFTEEYVEAHPHLRFCGVMGMASLTDNEEKIRGEFRIIKSVFDTFKSTVFAGNPDFQEVSMGMSHDYKSAIAEGCTMVRIGTSIFGERNY